MVHESSGNWKPLPSIAEEEGGRDNVRIAYGHKSKTNESILWVSEAAKTHMDTGWDTHSHVRGGYCARYLGTRRRIITMLLSGGGRTERISSASANYLDLPSRLRVSLSLLSNGTVTTFIEPHLEEWRPESNLSRTGYHLERIRNTINFFCISCVLTTWRRTNDVTKETRMNSKKNINLFSLTCSPVSIFSSHTNCLFYKHMTKLVLLEMLN